MGSQSHAITSFIADVILNNTLFGYEGNHLINFLIARLGLHQTTQLVNNYYLGTSNHWPGATVFWQVDINLRIRAGKIMLYNAITGKRVKQPFSHITWAHKAFNLPNFNMQQCLFGEHLLRNNTKPVAIVESEKTALIASVYLPQFTWLATGSLTNLTAAKCRVLQGHSVTLFPDLNAYDRWCDKAKTLDHITTFTVSDLLQRKAPAINRQMGFDLADYLLGPGEFNL